MRTASRPPSCLAGDTSTILANTCSVSPARTGLSQRSLSIPGEPMPQARNVPVSTNSPKVTEAVW